MNLSKKKSFPDPDQIGPYTILKKLGKGGMGEVFLVKDPVCGRKIALKRIKPELGHNTTIQNRFLREAKVASFLSHPSIVPILSISTDPLDIYYTMPFIEGLTLKQILKQTKDSPDLALDHSVGKSIPLLTRIFLQLCEAIAYTHSKGILHRDIKPENIIVGKYGEVMLLDWGIADFMQEPTHRILEEDLGISLEDKADLTRPGKITGTLAYMAPERLFHKKSSVQTDIYALGVILYQLLTLQLPFQRKTLELFKKQAKTEELVDPIEMAPYRDIPHSLSAICKKCLAYLEQHRYPSVETLIAEIKNYIEGRPEWIFLQELDPKNPDHWQFQENILLAKHLAISQSLDAVDWVGLMVSRLGFGNHLRIDTEVMFDSTSKGLGFLLNIPSTESRKNLEEGYCIWIGTKTNPSCRLFKNNVYVMQAKDVYLEPDRSYQIQIEKNEDQLRFFLDGKLTLYFTSYLPIEGSHIGLLHKDSGFHLRNFSVYDGNSNVTVNCLAVPNAFLSHKFYDQALREYRKIGESFPGRLEGREAMFRAGMTLIEKGRQEKKEKFFHLALKEFEKLAKTPGAPLEYLGKSLVYEALQDSKEEAKCLELGLRKFPKHPLLPILKEHIIYRMHETSLNNREGAYLILLLALRHIPDLLENPDTETLLNHLEAHWEPLFFIEKSSQRRLQLAIQLAFWLKKIPILSEIATHLATLSPIDETLLANTLFCMLELDALEEMKPFLSLPFEKIRQIRLLNTTQESFILSEKPTKAESRILLYQMRQALTNQNFKALRHMIVKCKRNRFSPTEKQHFEGLEIWSYLLQHKLSEASVVLGNYSSEELNQESSPLHFVYGVWLYMTQGPHAAFTHFGSIMDTPYPTTQALPGYFLCQKLTHQKEWLEKRFWWEKKELYRQIDLFYKAVGKHDS